MIKSLRQKWPVRDYPGAVAVTASTGIAGYNIGGHTLHSFGASCEPPPVFPSSLSWPSGLLVFLLAMALLLAWRLLLAARHRAHQHPH